ncbi:MAG: hypothetical protein ABI977_33260 [Acidobacteriota bacterium]
MKKNSGAAPQTPMVPLLKVADYLSRPQQFLAVAQARAGLREAIEAAGQRSVVLTNNGEPQAAIVPFETLETMRGALLQLLVGEMQGSFARLQQQVADQQNGQMQPEPTSEAELESLVKQARGQGHSKAAARRKSRR